MTLEAAAFGLSPSLWAADMLERMHPGAELDPWQVQVLDSQASQVTLNCSRQSGKSTVTAMLALWTAIYRPGSLVLIVSPSFRQSLELFKKVKDFLALVDGGPALTEDNKLSASFNNGSRIVALPGSEGTVRGFSAPSLIIIDEAARASDELYEALRPMLALGRGRLLLLSTPWGKRGFFHETWVTGDPGWLRIEIPAVSCPRISREFLESEKQAFGEWAYQQEYFCQFVDTEDQLFSYETIQSILSDQDDAWWTA